MSYDAPTPDEFIETFPELELTDDDVIQALIDLANRQVDETWLEDDYKTAIMYLAAHIYSANFAGAEAFGQDDIKSLSIGPLSITYGDKISAIELSTTSYGQVFAGLRRRNVPMVLVV